MTFRGVVGRDKPTINFVCCTRRGWGELGTGVGDFMNMQLM